MIKMLMTFAICMSCTAFVQASSTVLLESRTAGGMPGPNGPFSLTIQVLSNGMVQSTDGKSHKVVIAKLSNSSVAALTNQIADLKIEALTVPTGPECTDAPSTKVTVVKDGIKTVIGETVNCRDSVMDPAYKLLSTMHALLALSSNLK